MTFAEAYAMTGREFVRQVAQQMTVIEAVKTWSRAEKDLQLRALFDSACETWKRHGIATAESLLNDNAGSLHDFSGEIKRPAQPSVKPFDERKTA